MFFYKAKSDILLKDLSNYREEERNRRREKYERSIPVSANRSLGLAYSDDEEDEEENRDRKPTGGAKIAPPPSLMTETESTPNKDTSFGVSSVAAKIMAKMGYKEGQGLGREEQGISSALQVEKTSRRGGIIVIDEPFLPPPLPVSALSSTPPTHAEPTESITEIMKNPTKIVLLRNMVGPGEVDNDLEPETKEECSKYGEVVKCLIFEFPSGQVTDDEAVCMKNKSTFYMNLICFSG